MRIDAHQHFWNYSDSMTWITPAMSVIAKDFLPRYLQSLLAVNSIDGCVAVQAEQTTGETDFLLELARNNSFIKGVVGWTDLRAPNIIERLAAYTQNKKLKGFRHVLQVEAPEYMLHPDFMRGIGALETFGFTYDILVFPGHLEAVLELVKKFPGQPFVLDHMAKPNIREAEIDEWKKNIMSIAQCENVYCKISGMVTEADWQKWKPEDFIPYMDCIIESFGTDRIMYGSDWPVCLVAASYNEVIGIVEQYFSSFSENEQKAVFGENAKKFYHLL